MTVESAVYISQLNASLPTGSDGKAEGDNHLRLVKAVLLGSFPAVSGAVTASHTELNFVDGVTSAIQTQLDSKGAHAGQAWTGTQDFTGATLTVATKTLGDNSTAAASTAFVNGTAMAAALPAQPGNSGKLVTTNGSVASWAYPIGYLYSPVSTAISRAASAGEYVTVTASGTTQTLPASPTSGDQVQFHFPAGVTTTTIGRNGQPIMGISENLTVDSDLVTVTLRFITVYGWVLV